MRIANVKKVGRKPVYDLSVSEVEHYALKNGVVTHNTGILYSSNQAFIISKSQEKVKDELAGWKFTINVEKSRFVKEKSKLAFTVLYGSGIQKWSGLLELAMEAGYIIKPKVGWYQLIDPDTGEVSDKNYREAEVQNNDDFFDKLIKSVSFKRFVEKKYKLSEGGSDPNEEDTVDIED
jgi:hypothetical protein